QFASQCGDDAEAAGVSEFIAREIVGHESAAVSRQYTHLTMDDKRAAMQRKSLDERVYRTGLELQKLRSMLKRRAAGADNASKAASLIALGALWVKPMGIGG